MSKKLKTTDIFDMLAHTIITYLEVLNFLAEQKISESNISKYDQETHFKISNQLMRKILFDPIEIIKNNLRLNDTQIYFLPYFVGAIKQKTGNKEIFIGMNPEQYGYTEKKPYKDSKFHDFEKLETQVPVVEQSKEQATPPDLNNVKDSQVVTTTQESIETEPKLEDFLEKSTGEFIEDPNDLKIIIPGDSEKNKEIRIGILKKISPLKIKKFCFSDKLELFNEKHENIFGKQETIVPLKIIQKLGKFKKLLSLKTGCNKIMNFLKPEDYGYTQISGSFIKN